MNPYLNTAIRAARQAGNLILRYQTHVDRLTVTEKGRNDFVTQVDQEAEDEIVRILRAAYPDHAIQAEESGRREGNDYEWIIDPLDGTTNFLHGHPQFAVSIALRHRGQLDQAVVFDPLRDELFCASRGGGATLNNRRIRVSSVTHLRDALLGTGFPFKSLGRLEEWISGFRLLLVRSSGVRRAGSAALDLAYVACGRLDGFWELGLSPWDMAAGCLLIQEAGGLVSDLEGGRQYLASGDIVAGNPDVHAAILEVLRSRRS